MGPRANFACKKCQVTHEDLPVESTRCPVTGFKRGFKRLYDAVNVSGGQQRAAAQLLDRVMPGEFDRQREIQRAGVAARSQEVVAQPMRPYVPPAAVLAHARSAPNAQVAVPMLKALSGRGPTPALAYPNYTGQ